MTHAPWLPEWLARLWEIPGVTDVLVNGPGDAWVDRGLGLERAAEALPGVELPAHAGELRALAVRLASLAGRRLDDAEPTVDARLPDGTRLHAVLPPVADGCATLSLRRVRAGAFTLDDLAFAGTVQLELVPVLRGLVQARASVIVSGATGSGKTTLLASLLGEVDGRERIVLIEEAGELRPRHPHVVRLVERRANVDGAGAVGLARLTREALRMRPDRIVLGECRGAELQEVLLALNTGHRGGLTTVHANSAADVPARLVAMGALAGLSPAAVTLHAAAAFDVVIHLQSTDGERRIVEVGLLDLDARGELEVESAATVDGTGVLVPGAAWLRLASLAGVAARLPRDGEAALAAVAPAWGSAA